MRINNLLITHPNVSNSAVIVYMLLCHLAEVDGKFNRQVECNIKDMIALRQMSDRTIRTAIKQLVGEGIITVQHYSHGPSTYYLCDLEDPQPPKPRKTEAKPKITAVKPADTKESLLNNIYKIKNISENQISDIDDHESIFDSEKVRALPEDKVTAVKAVFVQLRDWRGTKPLYIGYKGRNKIAYLPEAVRRQMQRITVDQLVTVITLFDRKRVQGTGTAWIQAALMRPVSLAKQDSERMVRGEVALADHDQRKKGHFELERQYDFDEIEAALLKSTPRANVV